MAKIKALIPNLLTAGNLVGGVMAIIFALTGHLTWAPYCIFISAILDFFDGFVARLLKVQSELGKQLDSLADMVTFGVAPGVIVFVLFKVQILTSICPSFPNLTNEIGQIITGELQSNCMSDFSNSALSQDINEINAQGDYTFTTEFRYCGPKIDWIKAEYWYTYLPLTALFIPVFSMFRLGKFNLDTRQSDSFIGVPTPANTLFFASIPLILVDFSFSQVAWKLAVVDLLLNPIFLIVSTIIMSLLLVAELPLFALKFKSFGWKNNEVRYSFLTVCVVMLATLHWFALPLIIILYVLLSIIQNLLKR